MGLGRLSPLQAKHLQPGNQERQPKESCHQDKDTDPEFLLFLSDYLKF